MRNGEIFDMNKVTIGAKPIALTTFRFNNKTHPFVASDKPVVIYSQNQKLLYCNFYLTEVNHICSLNMAYFPDSIAIVNDDKLIIGSMGNISKLQVSSVPFAEQDFRIFHQDQSPTFSICSQEYNYDHTNNRWRETHFVKLFDDKSFENISSYALDTQEHGSFILSCSFNTDDNNFY